MRRILMTADTVGGVWTYALELSAALKPFGVEIVLATMGGSLDEEQRTAVSGLSNVELLESDYRLEWMSDPWEDVRDAGYWLLSIESRTHPDVIHLNGFAHGSLPWRVPVLMVGHSCVYSWFHAVKGSPPPSSWMRYRFEVRRGLRSADLVTAPTESMLSCLATHYGPFRSIGHIYNGRSECKFEPGRKEPFVFTAGRVWDEAKNTAALEQVAPHLPWPVLVAGESHHPEGGEKTLNSMVKLGKLNTEDLSGWLARASIFVLPARYEPFGLCALEAGLAGCALVLGNIPSLREVWEDNALYVQPDNPAELETAVLSLIESPLSRRRLSERARARAMRYGPEPMARAYMAVYEKLLAGKTKLSVIR